MKLMTCKSSIDFLICLCFNLCFLDGFYNLRRDVFLRLLL